MTDIIQLNNSNNGRVSSKKFTGNVADVSQSLLVSPFLDFVTKRFARSLTESALTQIAVSLDYPSTSAYVKQFLATGTQRNLTPTAPSRYYGCGTLTAPAVIDDTEISIEFFSGGAALNLVIADDWLALQTPVISGAHSGATIESIQVDSVTWAGDTATVTLKTGLKNNWALDSTAASAITTESIAATLDNSVKTNCSINEALIDLTNESTIEQTFTLSFTSATAFNCAGDTVGNLAAGNINSTYAPINPVTAQPYFSIPSGAFTAAITNATFVFQTHPAAVPFFTIVRIYPSQSIATLPEIGGVLISAY